MINWTLVAMLPFAIVIGAEIGRRRSKSAGRLVSFLPRHLDHVLTFFFAVVLVLFVESARAAIYDPTPLHLWLLILSSAFSHVMLITRTTFEISYARKRIERN